MHFIFSYAVVRKRGDEIISLFVYTYTSPQNIPLQQALDRAQAHVAIQLLKLKGDTDDSFNYSYPNVNQVTDYGQSFPIDGGYVESLIAK